MAHITQDSEMLAAINAALGEIEELKAAQARIDKRQAEIAKEIEALIADGAAKKTPAKKK